MPNNRTTSGALALLALSGSLHAQVVVEWDRDLQYALPERLSMGALHPGSNGGYVVSTARATFFQPSGEPGYWVEAGGRVLRLDAQGLVVGTQDIASSGFTARPHLAVDAAGGFAAAPSASDSTLVRVDGAGTIAWSTALPAAMQVTAGVGFGPGGAVHLGAASFSSPSFTLAAWSAAGTPAFSATTSITQPTSGSFALAADGRSAIAGGTFFQPLTVVVRAADGSLAWSWTGATGNEVSDVAFTPTGGLVVAGQEYVALTGRRAYLRRFDASGALLSTYVENGYALSRLEDVAVSADGEIAVVGDAFPALPGAQSAYVASFDANGALRFARTWSSALDTQGDWLHAVAYRASGEIVAGGRAFGNVPAPAASPAVACFTRDGALAWQHVAPALHDDEQCTSILETASGSIVCATRSLSEDVPYSNPAGGRVISLRSRANAFCFGDGTGTACPCANHVAVGSGAGCVSSIGRGARLVATGNASVGAGDLVLRGSDMPAMTTVLYFQGTLRQNGGAGAVFGDGKRCAGGTVTRLGTRTNVAGASQLPSNGSPPIAVQGGVAAGDVRTYQAWYRNSASFCTPSGFNLTNGVEVTWGS